MKTKHSKTNKLNTKLSFNLTPRSFSHRAGTKHNTSQKNQKNNKLNKSSKSLVVFQKNITLKFLQILNTVKLYHWKTKSYASHKATDELYTKLNDLFDQFTEILLGKLNNRIHLEKYKTLPLKDMASDQDMVKEMQLFKNYLVSLNNSKEMKTMSNTDLYSIRDEILGDVNQYLYLLSFS